MSEAMDALMFAMRTSEADKGRIAACHLWPHDDLAAFRDRLTLTHWNRRAADLLAQTGLRTVPADSLTGQSFDEVWLLPDRQRECQLGELAVAWSRLRTGGRLRVSLSNDLGAKWLENAWRSVAGAPVETLSKHHCRVFTTLKTETGWDEGRLKQWQDGAALRRLPDSGWWSRPGLFSWDRPDPGTTLLATHLPETLAGHGADLGVGWGYLSMELLRHCPELTALDGYEVDDRALEPARRNLGNVMVPVRPRLYWRDVTAGIGQAKYDFIVTNPPFHEGRDADPSLGLRFIAAAARALKKEGSLWLVANKHLPYEPLLAELFLSCPL
jgi:16S rRNA (guanine1207-N2)-methyltransferase